MACGCGKGKPKVKPTNTSKTINKVKPKKQLNKKRPN